VVRGLQVELQDVDEPALRVEPERARTAVDPRGHEAAARREPAPHEAEHEPGHAHLAVQRSRQPVAAAAAVADEDRVLGEQVEQGGHVAVPAGAEEPAHQLVLLGPGVTAPRSPFALPGLTGSGLSALGAVLDLSDLRAALGDVPAGAAGEL